jgi:hypothetical protein
VISLTCETQALEVLSKIAREILDRGVFAQLLRLAIASMLLDAEVSTDALKKLDHLRRFLLGQEIDLQIEVAALVSFGAHPILAYENESAQKNGFQRQDHRQKREWEWIICRDGFEQSTVDQYPGRDPDDLDDDEHVRAGEFPNSLRQPVSMRKVFLLFGFESNNRVNIGLMNLRGLPHNRNPLIARQANEIGSASFLNTRLLSREQRRPQIANRIEL